MERSDGGATVTIGLLAFNAVDTLERAVRSAQAQSWPALEIIIVDDASSDGTLALARRLAAEHEAVRLVARSENGGAAVSRNVVVAEARGEFIAFFDDDDVSAPRRIELQLRRLMDYERTIGDNRPVVCHAARLQHYPDGTRRVESTMGEAPNRPAPSGVAVARRILAGAPLEGAYGSCATCTQLVRTAVLRELGGFDPDFRRSQDTELCVRLAKAGAHFVGIGEPLVEQTMTRTSDKGIERERRHWLALVDKHRDVFASEVEYRACRRWIDVRHDWLSRQWGRFWQGVLYLAATHPVFTGRRFWMALRKLPSNVAFSRFHLGR